MSIGFSLERVLKSQLSVALKIAVGHSAAVLYASFRWPDHEDAGESHTLSGFGNPFLPSNC